MKPFMILVLATEAICANDTAMYYKHGPAYVVNDYCEGMDTCTMYITNQVDYIALTKFIAEVETCFEFPNGEAEALYSSLADETLVDESTGHTLPSQHY